MLNATKFTIATKKQKFSLSFGVKAILYIKGPRAIAESQNESRLYSEI
jgi:hypothetical protein